MNDRDRLEHLRGLLDRLERMPTSADRDWMLSEVRARTVDVETGVSPAAVRALPVGDAPAEIAAAGRVRVEPSDRPARRTPTRVPSSRRATARAAGSATRARPAVLMSPSSLATLRARPRPEGVVDLLPLGGLLCLSEAQAETGIPRPW